MPTSGRTQFISQTHLSEHLRPIKCGFFNDEFFQDHEFCFYDKRNENSFVKDGVLHIRPTLTEAAYGKNFISNGKLVLEGYIKTKDFFSTISVVYNF
jgi:hypothetical protein